MKARWPPREQHSQQPEPNLTGQKRDNNVVSWDSLLQHALVPVEAKEAF